MVVPSTGVLDQLDLPAKPEGVWFPDPPPDFPDPPPDDWP